MQLSWEEIHSNAIENRRKQFKTKDLHKNIRHFSLLAGYETKREIEEQDDVNIRAAEKMAKLHDALKKFGYEGHCLQQFPVAGSNGASKGGD